MQRKIHPYFIVLALGIISFSFVYFFEAKTADSPLLIKGINLEAPPRPFDGHTLNEVKAVHADWVAVIPYAFTSIESAEIFFDGDRQWWGEKSEGVVACIEMAQKLGLNVMIKPHLWVKGQGWAGDFMLNSEEKWLSWEKSYKKYMMTYAKIAARYKVPLLCIGTECRQVAIHRPDFWRSLIADIRHIYDGRLTYAANWDNYQNVAFWDQLDFIGIDAYFPLSDQKTPAVWQLNKDWQPHHQEIRQFSEKWDRPIIFTEYGYKSIDYATIGHWKVSPDTLEVNLDGQANAYESIYQTFWHEPWFKGGFLWKWHISNGIKKRKHPTSFTPQGKPAMAVIEKWHRKVRLGR
ncbi:hypothetical protein QQ020_35215 [Fulvivirgaceae bacterium BMA12]|uniref:Glycoside hydrolase n=1 Tax=Agaribacillus aureus TaxID=3051825 RepID=A0ABT8LHV1_9BACT|nr:hypothetical protein [Fulvivirgaceae bacterium BMA12]